MERDIFILEEQLAEVVDALKTAIGHIPQEGVYATNSVYVTPAQQLRQQANAIEQKERDLEYINKIIEKYEE